MIEINWFTFEIGQQKSFFDFLYGAKRRGLRTESTSAKNDTFDYLFFDLKRTGG